MSKVMEKDTLVQFRVSQAEKDTLKRLAKDTRGVHNTSQLFRKWLKTAADEKGMRVQRSHRVQP